jgi:hypothetical protein
MKINWFVRILAAAMLLANASLAAESAARIGNVWLEKTNVVVEVQTEGNVLKVTLESSTRVGRRAWEPRAVRFLTNGEPENVRFTFKVPLVPNMEILRVRTDFAASSLPASFYSGTNSFVTGAEDGGGAFRGGLETTAPAMDAAPGGDAPRAVVESDIWKLEGDRLFFFNQYRGLQVIDVSNPDEPVVTGVYEVPAAGEQMYVIGGNKVVLLARDNCAWWGGEAESRLILLEVRNGVPEVVKTLPVSGQIAETRLVGTALYVVANAYRKQLVPRPGSTDAGEIWEWGSEVTSYDLSSFATANRKSVDWVNGYGNVITATEKYLFVAQTDYSQSPATTLVHSFDISSPDGAFTKLAAFAPGGIVRDKFKMHISGNIFTAVVQENNRLRGTYVSTWSFENPQKPSRLAYLKIIENEQLFATRFDGDRLYIVTFFIIDPLWIVDLSNPANPKKVGELEIPGWSTYLQPMGDRLLAIGLDQTNGFQQTAVQLFDVADPANPRLASKVLIGDQWSGSEANWDEKAFGVLPQHNLLLVPFHSSGPSGYFEGVQLIDLKDGELTKRGVIQQNMGARRATVHRDRILSLSSRELLTVDAVERDKPSVVNKLELSWAADQVHLVGDFVVEIEAYRSGGPLVRVVDANNTERIRSTVALTNLPYLGSAVSGGKLLVLQGKSVEHIYPERFDPNDYKPIKTNPAVYVLSTFELSRLPELTILAAASKESTRAEYLHGRYQALEVQAGLLVWSSSSRGGMPWYWWRGGGGIAIDAIAAPSRGIMPWWGGNSGHLLATAVGTPTFLSEVSLTGTNGWWSFSDAFTTNNLVYLSHSANEYDPTIDPPPVVWEYYDGTKTVRVTNDPPPGVWVQRHYLDVIDYTEPTEPIVRKPVNIPGKLIGLDRGGEVIFTRAYDLQFSSESISAASYDGVQSRLIDSFKAGENWPRPSISAKGFIYLGVAGTNSTSGRLESWRLNEAGKFEIANTQSFNQPIQEFASFGDLLVAQASRILLFDLASPARPRLAGTGEANSCYGIQLSAADGSVERGLWLPMGWYGVVHIPIEPPIDSAAP